METQNKTKAYLRNKRFSQEITEVVLIRPLAHEWGFQRGVYERGEDYPTMDEIKWTTDIYAKLRVYGKRADSKKPQGLLKELGKSIRKGEGENETEILKGLEQRGRRYETLANKLAEKYGAKLTILQGREEVLKDGEAREKRRLYHQQKQRRKNWRNSYYGGY